jgi:hypothetical protein
VGASYEVGYASGFKDGSASRNAEVEALQRMVDFWYFRANNPRSSWPEVKMVNSLIDGMEANEERARLYAELDRREEELFSRARALIAEGKEDLAIATEVGLFLPIVANLRAGVL